MTRYSTRDRVLEFEVYPAIDQFSADFDVAKLNAAFDPFIEYFVDTDESGNELLNTEGFELTCDEATFWDLVMSADISA